MPLTYGTGPLGEALGAMSLGATPRAAPASSAAVLAAGAVGAKMLSMETGFRSHTCGDLRLADVESTVSLCGWVQQSRDMNHFAFVDLRDRYGITQCVFHNEATEEATALYEGAKKLGREWVVQVTNCPL
ncbi:hypothetical protein T492DRAFT_854951 [Pavlovales sp. CCMP2436]|nr:hypothetical protein T492DRAFT_854951 [Pavlovales sp. CCMP2436]